MHGAASRDFLSRFADQLLAVHHHAHEHGTAVDGKRGPDPFLPHRYERNRSDEDEYEQGLVSGEAVPAVPIEARRREGIRFVSEAIAELEQGERENEIHDAENSIQSESKQAERLHDHMAPRARPVRDVVRDGARYSLRSAILREYHTITNKSTAFPRKGVPMDFGTR